MVWQTQNMNMPVDSISKVSRTLMLETGVRTDRGCDEQLAPTDPINGKASTNRDE